jgi:hypothetical protein
MSNAMLICMQLHLHNFSKEMQQWHLLQRLTITELYTPPWKPVIWSTLSMIVCFRSWWQITLFHQDTHSTETSTSLPHHIMQSIRNYIINNKLCNAHHKQQTSTIFKVEPNLMTKTNMFIMLQLLVSAAMVCCKDSTWTSGNCQSLVLLKSC